MEHRLSGGVLPWTPQQLVHHVGFTANQPKTREDDLTFKSLHTQSCIHFSQLWPFIKKNDTWIIFYFIDTGQLRLFLLWISLFFLLPWIVTSGSFYDVLKSWKHKLRSTENRTKCCCDLSLMTWALDVGIWNQPVCPDGASLSGHGHSLFGWLFVVSCCIQTVHNHETIMYENLWECLIGRLCERYARFKQKLTVNVRTECELWKDFVERLIVSTIWRMYEYNVLLL